MAQAALSMWLLLLFAWALLPGRAEWAAGAGAPHWIQQKEQDVSVLKRSCESVCLPRLRGSDRAWQGAGIPGGNPVGHLHVPDLPGDIVKILLQTCYKYSSYLC